MKKSMSFVLISCLFISMQPLMAQEEAMAVVEEVAEPQQQIAPEEPAIEQQEVKPSAVLSWWRSLRRPTRQDWQNLKSYVNSKYRCLRYGEACSRKERAVLGALVAIVTVAAAKGTVWGVKKVKKARAYKKILDEEGQQWLTYAQDGDLEGIQRRITEGIDVNVTDFEGRTALILAALEGHTEAVGALLAVAGIDVNIQNRHGFTALMMAALEEHTEIARMLLKAGADWRIRNNRGQAALDYAINYRDPFVSSNKDVIKELIKAGADYSAYFENRIVQEAVGELWSSHKQLEREIGGRRRR